MLQPITSPCLHAWPVRQTYRRWYRPTPQTTAGYFLLYHGTQQKIEFSWRCGSNTHSWRGRERELIMCVWCGAHSGGPGGRAPGGGHGGEAPCIRRAFLCLKQYFSLHLLQFCTKWCTVRVSSFVKYVSK